jgi:hypothetical protein
MADIGFPPCVNADAGIRPSCAPIAGRISRTLFAIANHFQFGAITALNHTEVTHSFAATLTQCHVVLACTTLIRMTFKNGRCSAF